MIQAQAHNNRLKAARLLPGGSLLVVASLLVLALALLCGCEKLQVENKPTILKLVLPADFEGAFKVVPAGEPGVPLPLEKGKTTVWEVPADGVLKVKSTRELSDPEVRVVIESAEGKRLPLHDLRNMAADHGVFKLYTDTGGEHIWFVGSGKERALAYAIPREALPMAINPYEYARQNREEVNKEMSTTQPP